VHNVILKLLLDRLSFNLIIVFLLVLRAIVLFLHLNSDIFRDKETPVILLLILHFA